MRHYQAEPSINFTLDNKLNSFTLGGYCLSVVVQSRRAHFLLRNNQRTCEQKAKSFAVVKYPGLEIVIIINSFTYSYTEVLLNYHNFKTKLTGFGNNFIYIIFSHTNKMKSVPCYFSWPRQKA